MLKRAPLSLLPALALLLAGAAASAQTVPLAQRIGHYIPPPPPRRRARPARPAPTRASAASPSCARLI